MRCNNKLKVDEKIMITLSYQVEHREICFIEFLFKRLAYLNLTVQLIIIQLLWGQINKTI